MKWIHIDYKSDKLNVNNKMMNKKRIENKLLNSNPQIKLNTSRDEIYDINTHFVHQLILNKDIIE